MAPSRRAGASLLPRRSALRYLLLALASAPSLLTLAGCVILGGCGSVVETSWSPDAGAIAYTAGGELRVYDPATKQSKVLDTGPDDALSPAWSPDGKTIAFYYITYGKEATVALQAIDLDSGRVRTLAPDVWPLPRTVDPTQVQKGQAPDQALLEAQQEASLGVMFAATIAWSPDSARLASVAASPSGGRVLLVNCASGDSKPIIEEKDGIITLAWAPDGKRLAYVRGTGPPIERATRTADKPAAPPGGQPEQEQSLLPGFEGPSSLWLYDFDSGARSLVCGFPPNAFVPGTRLEWSADSTRIGCIVADPHSSGRAIGCIVDARAGSAIREILRGMTPASAWAPGLRGAAFLEEREQGQVVLLYRGLIPPTRKVLGALTFPSQEVPAESSDRTGQYSLPDFSRDGQKLALRVGQDEGLKIVVYDLP